MCYGFANWFYSIGYLGKRKTMTGPMGKRYKTVLGYKRGAGIYGPAVVAVAARRNRAPRAPKGAIKPSGRTELKYVDVAQASYALDTTGSVTMLNGIAVGDDNTTRDGRQVTIKSVQLHGLIVPQDGSVGVNKTRVLLVWDNAANGALATIAQIMSAANGTAFPLVDNANRFTILVDRIFAAGSFDNTATQAISSSPAHGDVDIYKVLRCCTQYSGTGATIASIQNGALLLVTLGTQAAASGHNLFATTRVRFTDD